MTVVSKNVYIDKLDDVINEYNNTYRTIKMKSIEVKDNTYIDSVKEVNDKNPKFKVDNHVRKSKNKNIFAKGYGPYWSGDVFVIKEVENTDPSTYVITDLNEDIVGTFQEKELQKTNQQGQEKSLKEKEINYMSNGKVMIIYLIAGLIKDLIE